MLAFGAKAFFLIMLGGVIVCPLQFFTGEEKLDNQRGNLSPPLHELS